MPDLSTTYLGLKLKNPIVPSPSPLMQKLDNIKRMEDAGAGALVLHSLFEEQIMQASQLLDHYLDLGAESFAEALSYFPEAESYNLGPEGYLEHIRRAKETVGVPVIASLNGVSTGGWVEYARQIEQAGADALELNMYYLAADPSQTGAQVEQMYLDLVRQVKAYIRIPVAVKLGSSFTALANFAQQLATAGAGGLVLFNRFYQPDLDLDNLEVVSNLNLSSSVELRLRLRWAGILYGRINTDLAITGGVHTGTDALKCMMAGARVAMIASVMLEHGIGRVRTLLADMARWMDEHEYASVQQMQGSMSQKAVAYPAAFERANYLKVLRTYKSPL